MQISWTASGGFVGPAWPQRHCLDSNELPTLWQQEWYALLEQAGFFTTLADALKAAPRASDFLYRLEIQDGLRQHAIQFHLGENAALDGLLRHLQAALALVQTGAPDN